MRVNDPIEANKKYYEWLRIGGDEVIFDSVCFGSNIDSFEIPPSYTIFKNIVNQGLSRLVCLFNRNYCIKSKEVNSDEEANEYAKYLYRYVMYEQFVGEELCE